MVEREYVTLCEDGARSTLISVTNTLIEQKKGCLTYCQTAFFVSCLFLSGPGKLNKWIALRKGKKSIYYY